jgi:hypothetical protein
LIIRWIEQILKVRIGALESCAAKCQMAVMAERGVRNTQAGGFILAVSIIAGTVGGVITRQTSAGIVVGTAVGIILLTLFWLMERNR